MKEHGRIKIHTVPRRDGCYNNPDSFWLSLLSSKLCVSQAALEEKISLICAYDSFLAQNSAKSKANIIKKAGKQP